MSGGVLGVLLQYLHPIVQHQAPEANVGYYRTITTALRSSKFLVCHRST